MQLKCFFLLLNWKRKLVFHKIDTKNGFRAWSYHLIRNLIFSIFAASLSYLLFIFARLVFDFFLFLRCDIIISEYWYQYLHIHVFSFTGHHQWSKKKLAWNFWFYSESFKFGNMKLHRISNPLYCIVFLQFKLLSILFFFSRFIARHFRSCNLKPSGNYKLQNLLSKCIWNMDIINNNKWNKRGVRWTFIVLMHKHWTI